MLTLALSICGRPVQPRTAGCISIADAALAGVVNDAWCDENCAAAPDSEPCGDKCSCPNVAVDPATLSPPVDDAAADDNERRDEKLSEQDSLAENRRLQEDLQKQKADLQKQLAKLQDEEQTILARMAKRDADEMKIDEAVAKGECHGTCKYLSERFLQGQPSNDLKDVGLLVHCFDDTEKEDARWVPVDGRAFWSTTVINWRQRSVFGQAGIIIKPSAVDVLCAYAADMGTMEFGCKVTRQQYLPGNLAGMVNASMSHGAGNDWAGANADDMYNEVLVDPKSFSERLPASVAAFVYDLRKTHGFAEPTDTPDDFDNTAQIYLNFLKQYDLTEADVPLLRVEYKTPFDPDNPDLPPESHEGRAVFTDVSSIATRLAATHRLSKGKKGGGTPPRRWVPGHHYRSGAAARNPPY